MFKFVKLSALVLITVSSVHANAMFLKQSVHCSQQVGTNLIRTVIVNNKSALMVCEAPIEVDLGSKPAKDKHCAAAMVVFSSISSGSSGTRIEGVTFGTALNEMPNDIRFRLDLKKSSGKTAGELLVSNPNVSSKLTHLKLPLRTQYTCQYF